MELLKENIEHIGDTLAEAIYIYMSQDRVERDAAAPHDFARHTAWYHHEESS